MKTFFNLGLIGYPLGHSLSPQIHKAALDSCGLEGNYSLFPVRPEDYRGLKNLLVRVRSGEIAGLNVTIPHKQTVVSLLDGLTPRAELIGAVNTIFMQNDTLIGDNTDAPGFLADLHRFITTEIPRRSRTGEGDGAGELQRGSKPRHRNTSLPPVERGKVKFVLVLGAGGSARAVVYALINAGWNVTLSARRIEQAQSLLTQFPIPNSRLSVIEYPLTKYHSLVSSLSLIVNTTPLGMSPDAGSSPWPEGLFFPPHAALYDLVYNPRETKLVKDARAAGLSATTGLGMLIEQAALSFEIWTGRVPPREALWNPAEA